MGKEHDLFISKYKIIEGLLREKGMSVKDYEDIVLEPLDSSLRQKMSFLRITRNYIQHEPDYEKFIAITPTMMETLEKIIYLIKISDGIVKDIMITSAKYGSMDTKDKIIDAAVLLKKKNHDIMVFNKNEFVGFLTKEMISDTFAGCSITKNTNISKCIFSPTEIDRVDINTPISDLIKNKKYLVVNKNKILGIVCDNK